MSTSDQHGGAPLTRKQLREARLTGATAVITEEQAHEARAARRERDRADAAATPATPPPSSQDAAPLMPSASDAAEPLFAGSPADSTAPAPPVVAAGTAPEVSSAAPDEGARRPLTRRAVRERVRTAPVPVADADGADDAVPVDAGERPAAFLLPPDTPAEAETGVPESVDADAEEQVENVDALPPVSAFLSWSVESEEPPAVESSSVFEAVRRRDARAGSTPVPTATAPAVDPAQDTAPGHAEEDPVLPKAAVDPASPVRSAAAPLFPASSATDPVFPADDERTSAPADRTPPVEEHSSSWTERIPPRPERIPPREEPILSAPEPRGRVTSSPVVTEGFGAAVLDSGENAGEVSRPTPRSFDDLLSTDSAGSQHAAPNALIFQQPGGPSLSGPVASTGEILVTGSYELPEGLGSQGHAKGTADGKEVDALLIDGELPPASSPTPIAASAAISTIKPAGEVIRPAEPEKSNRLMVALTITAGALAVALVGALIVAITTGAFS
ncbi:MULTISPECIES: hypothetical protein [Bacteria]|uniref:hypothetical protein n=1 Tax=Bacteria TaxID=2 RepID=UPI003C7DBAC7